jgi:hypothetical protein
MSQMSQIPHPQKFKVVITADGKELLNSEFYGDTVSYSFRDHSHAAQTSLIDTTRRWEQGDMSFQFRGFPTIKLKKVKKVKKNAKRRKST